MANKKKAPRLTDEQIVSNWNAKNLVGTPVVLTEDDGSTTKTTTRSIAWILGDGTPVVSVVGKPAGYLLSRIKPVRSKSKK